jgi:hypothetical protein
MPKTGSVIALDISVNGRRACIAGGTNGSFGAMISRIEDGSDALQFHVTGSGEMKKDGTADYVQWNVPPIKVGDEITIRIVETDSSDSPDQLESE